MEYGNRGVSIKGNKLSNLRFADDVTIIAQGLKKLEHSVNELPVASLQQGLKINMAKTKLLRNKYVTQRPVFVEGSVVEEVQSYIHVHVHLYLGEKRVLLKLTWERK